MQYLEYESRYFHKYHQNQQLEFLIIIKNKAGLLFYERVFEEKNHFVFKTIWQSQILCKHHKTDEISPSVLPHRVASWVVKYEIKHCKAAPIRCPVSIFIVELYSSSCNTLHTTTQNTTRSNNFLICFLSGSNISGCYCQFLTDETSNQLVHQKNKNKMEV